MRRLGGFCLSKQLITHMIAILRKPTSPTEVLRMPKSKNFSILFDPSQLALVKKAAKARGFDSVASYLRALLDQDAGRAVQQEGLEVAFAASLERMAKELRRLHNADQALFAMIDSLVRLVLTCIPEPPSESLDATKRRAKVRYERFMVSVAQSMTGDAKDTLGEIVRGRPNG